MPSRRIRFPVAIALLILVAGPEMVPGSRAAERGSTGRVEFSELDELVKRYPDRMRGQTLSPLGQSETEIIPVLGIDTWPATPWGGRWQYVQTGFSTSLTFLGYDGMGRLRAHYHTDPFLLGRRPDRYDDYDSAPEIGESLLDLLWTPPWTNNALGFIVAESMRERAKADAAILNALCLRGNIPRGRITEKHVSHVLPFDNEIYRIEIPAWRLASLLMEGLWDKNEFNIAGREFHFSGVKLNVWSAPGMPFKLEAELTRSDGRPIPKMDTLAVALPSYVFDTMNYRSLELESLDDPFADDSDPSPLFSHRSVGRMRQAFRSYVIDHSPLHIPPPNLTELSEDSIAGRVRKDLEVTLAAVKRRNRSGNLAAKSAPCGEIRTETSIWIPNHQLVPGIRAVPDGSRIWVATMVGLGLIEPAKGLSIYRLPSRITDLEMREGELWVTTWANRGGDDPKYDPGVIECGLGYDDEDDEVPSPPRRPSHRRTFVPRKVVHVFDIHRREWIRTFSPEPPVRDVGVEDGGDAEDNIERLIREELRLLLGRSGPRWGTSIIYDPHEPVAWVTATPGGLFLYDTERRALSDLRPVFTVQDMGSPLIDRIFFTKRHVWVVTKSWKDGRGGLLQMDRETRHWMTFRKEISDGRFSRMDEERRRASSQYFGAEMSIDRGEPVWLDVQTMVASDEYIWVVATSDVTPAIPYVAEYNVLDGRWTRYSGRQMEEPLMRMVRGWRRDKKRLEWMGRIDNLLSHLRGIPNASVLPASPGPDIPFNYGSGVWVEKVDGGVERIGEITDPVRFARIRAVRGRQLLVHANGALEIVDLSDWTRRQLIDSEKASMGDDEVWRMFQVDGGLLFCEDHSFMGWERDEQDEPQRLVFFDWDAARLTPVSTLMQTPLRFLRKIFAGRSSGSDSNWQTVFPLEDGRRAVWKPDGLWIE